MLLASLRIHRLILQIVDILTVVIAFVLAFYVRTVLGEHITFLDKTIGVFLDYSPFLVPLMATTPFVLSWLDFYSIGTSYDKGQQVNTCLQASIMLFLVEVLLMFFFKEDLSRFVFMFFVPIATVLLFTRLQALRFLRQRLGRSETRMRNLLLVTDSPDKELWANRVNNHPELGFRLNSVLEPDKVLLNDFIDVLHRNAIQLAIFDIKKTSLDGIAEKLQACEDEGIEVWLSTGIFQTRIAQAKVDYFANEPILIFRSTPDSSLQLLGKALMDRAGALVLLAIFTLPMLFIGLLIRMTSKGPALFAQERSGHYGKNFRMLKFRSMVSNAEQLKDELDRLNEMSGPVFKISKDPRITPIGSWLRKTSLDELPQLINVLKGEMSLVGPRPLPVYETLAISKNEQRRRLSVKPGITCLWQISGRNQVTDFEDWVRLDLDYIDQWSLGLDIKILLKTIPAVLFRHGAR